MIAHDDGPKPTRVDVARWIHDSWKQVTAETITNTWNSIGLQGWVVAGQEGGGRGTINKRLQSARDRGGFPPIIFFT